MENIQLIDVTLRDGGYRNNFNFSDDNLSFILTLLDQSCMEYIEVGYRNGSLLPIENIGEAGLCPSAYLQRCRALIKNSKLTVMLHPHNVCAEDLDQLKALSVDTLRVCLTHGKHKEVFEIIEKAKERDFEVSVNITRMSHYSDEDLDLLFSDVIKQPIDIIYFADSNGSMLPPKVKSLYEKYINQTSISLGFHAHDNLGLAQANAIAACEAGARYIDVSLSGFGKGIGNLKSDFFIAYLNAINIKKYTMNSILEASNYVRKTLRPPHETFNMDEFLMGIEDLSIDDIRKINQKKNMEMSA